MADDFQRDAYEFGLPEQPEAFPAAQDPPEGDRDVTEPVVREDNAPVSEPAPPEGVGHQDEAPGSRSAPAASGMPASFAAFSEPPRAPYAPTPPPAEELWRRSAHELYPPEVPSYARPPAAEAWQPYKMSQPAPAKGGRGWKIGFICLLVAATFFTGAVVLSAEQRGLWSNAGQFGSLDPERPPEGLPVVTPPNSQESPGRDDSINGNAPLDDSGETSLEIFDRPADASASAGQALTISQIAEKALPSVVGILAGSEGDYNTSSGSGIIMTADGYIITNNHVVEGFNDITVVLSDGTEYKVTQARTDRNTDLAVLKIEATGLKPAEFGNSDHMAVGDLAVVIGNPLGMELQSTVTNGIISAINRDIVIEDLRMTMLQTNCAINPGNSGGPLINEYGQVVGIISSKIMSDYLSGNVVEGLGFAIPSNIANPIVNELITRGYVKGRPAIGITGSSIDERNARFLGVPPGLQVVSINPKCDAYAQGLRVDDIITAVMEQPVTTVQEVNLIKNDYQVGDSLTVSVYRPSEQRAFDITFKLMDNGELNQ